MNITELEQYRLSDAVRFHDRLNPSLWTDGEKLQPQVRESLLRIARDFQEFLGVEDLDLEDITISGSNAAYSYTPTSDIDLHLVVKMPDDEIYQELFDAKKYQYNDQHDIKIRDQEVELYVQAHDEPHISQGIYSVLNDQWVRVPSRRRARVDDSCVKAKFQDLTKRIDTVIKVPNPRVLKKLWDKIKAMRKTGLAKHGEFGCENLVFKLLRNSGALTKLQHARNEIHDQELGLAEKKQPKVRYGFSQVLDRPTPSVAELAKKHGVPESHIRAQLKKGVAIELEHTTDPGVAQEIARDHLSEFPDYYDRLAKAERVSEDDGASSTWDGVSPDTQEFLNEDPDTKLLKDFITHTAKYLGIENMPHIHLHRDPTWSESNHSFGRYDPESHDLHVSLPNRHILDIMRTTAHELTHCRQHEIGEPPDDAGETGSPWENQAHATAGIIMRDFADNNPGYFGQKNIHESRQLMPRTQRAIVSACMALGISGCASLGDSLRTTRDVSDLVQKIQRSGAPGMQEELAQELKNYIRARGGDANAQNQSILFRKEREIRESSGYVPTNAERNDPRFEMALSQDVRPGEIGRQANKLDLDTDAQGHPNLVYRSKNPRGS